MEKTITNFRAGYGRADITPDFEVGLDCYGDSERRRTSLALDPLYATCVAVQSDEKTALLFTVDISSVTEGECERIRQVVEEATGISGIYIYIGTTHNHSAPIFRGSKKDRSVTDFQKIFYAGMVKAARQALADLAPAQLQCVTKALPGMNFVRHYLMEDGTYAGSNFGDRTLRIVGHATQGDPRMVLVKFARQIKRDILLMNWQAHNDNARAVGYHNISASYTGRIRAYLEKDTGMHFAYLCGAGGNQNTDSWIPEEKHGLNWLQYARKLADYALEALPEMQPVAGTGIEGVRVMYDIPVNHQWDYLVKEAREVHDLWKTVGKPEADELAKSYGMTSCYQAGSILAHAPMPDTDPLELNAFRIGNLGFITGTFEMFSNTGLHVRANSPFDTTVIITGNIGYMAPKEAYAYRSYEADTSVFACGAQELVAEQYVQMLNKI